MKFNFITKINVFSKSFDFLKSEPEIYSLKDINKMLKKYAYSRKQSKSTKWFRAKNK
jgi:hypothetical protein